MCVTETLQYVSFSSHEASHLIVTPQTNTAVGSPYVNQAQQLPPVPPPPVRDPMLATGEWRDRTEEQQQKRKKNRPRPGVTFDVEEDPPSPYAGRQKGARLVRRKSGRTSTPGPIR